MRRIAILLAAAAHLAGADLRWQFQVNSAQGKLRSVTGDRLGYSLGVYTITTLVNEDMIRPRADITFFPAFKLTGVQAAASSLALGCDYLRALKGSFHNFYLVGGASLLRWSQGTIGQGSENSTRLGLSAGVGCTLTDVIGLEARYTNAPLTSQIHACTLGAVVTWRF
jgi:hypothetical protein